MVPKDNAPPSGCAEKSTEIALKNQLKLFAPETKNPVQNWTGLLSFELC
jgi:hypothetical protein